MSTVGRANGGFAVELVQFTAIPGIADSITIVIDDSRILNQEAEGVDLENCVNKEPFQGGQYIYREGLPPDPPA